MIKKRDLIALALGIAYFTNSMSCTNILVTKGASADGSTMITYSADSHTLYGELYYKPAKDYPEGTMLSVYEWDSNNTKYMGKIKQVAHTYSVVGNMNEYQVVIAETTYGGHKELEDTTAIIDYGSLMYITLQRSKTALEAIETIKNLVNEYGYASSGESFSIADANEVWVMDIIGKGVGNKGAIWVARKVPDGYICAHANQARIRQFPLNDPKNCLYAPDVISFAKEKGYFKGEDKDFSFVDAYAPVNFESLRFCEARVYSIFNHAAPSFKIPIDYAKGDAHAVPMPLWIKPDKKLAVKDVMAFMRDHYEGTEFDMTQDIGAAPYACPYRWRPLTWKVDSTHYFNERAISTQQTGFSFVSQSRSWMPNTVGGVLWFGVDDTYSTVYTPMYSCMNQIPNSFAEGNGNMFEYSTTSAFWAFNLVSNFAYTRYNAMIVDIQKVQSELENKFFAYQPAIEKAALELYNAGNKELAQQFLTEYSVQQGELTTKRWQQLFQNLFIKYMDGNVKVNGKLTQPGYPNWWYKAIIEETGNKFKVE
jgi:dipeptidase